MKLNQRSILVSGLIALFISCRHSNQPEETPESGQLTISVDESLQPALQQVIQQFQRIYPGVHVTAEYKPESKAVEDIISKHARLAVTTRKLNDEESEHYKQMGFVPEQYQFATDAVAFIVNPQRSDTNLSYRQITSILKGETVTWNQLNSSHTPDSIILVFDNNQSGALRFIQEEVLKKAKLPFNSFVTGSNPSVINYVAQNKNAIGIIGISWISQTDDSLTSSFLSNIKVVGVSPLDSPQNNSYYLPTRFNILSGFYPFHRAVYFINAEPQLGPGTGFASYLASEEGQLIILHAGLLPAKRLPRIIELKDDFENEN